MTASPKKANAPEIIAKSTKKKKVDWSKFVGTIKLKEDPLKLQKKWRNEWK
jgi:hypothetical protein